MNIFIISNKFKINFNILYIKSVFCCRFVHNDIKYPNFDKYRKNSAKNPKIPSSEHEVNRKMQSALGMFLLASVTTVAVKSTAWKWISSMSTSKDVLALAKSEIKISEINVDNCKVFKWRGKPLFIWHRTPEMIERERKIDIMTLPDPQSDEDRCPNPEWLVVLGICTHLGCVPVHHDGEFFGFYCPCHGSHYDGAGRIRKGPAPRNLEIPPYNLAGDILTVG